MSWKGRWMRLRNNDRRSRNKYRRMRKRHERYVLRRINLRWMQKKVSYIDPSPSYIITIYSTDSIICQQILEHQRQIKIEFTLWNSGWCWGEFWESRGHPSTLTRGSCKKLDRNNSWLRLITNPSAVLVIWRGDKAKSKKLKAPGDQGAQRAGGSTQPRSWWDNLFQSCLKQLQTLRSDVSSRGSRTRMVV